MPTECNGNREHIAIAYGSEPCPLCASHAQIRSLQEAVHVEQDLNAQWQARALKAERAHELEKGERERVWEQRNALRAELDFSKAFYDVVVKERALLLVENERLKADQADWRSGVEHIASAAGLNTAHCITIARKILKMRAALDEKGQC